MIQYLLELETDETCQKCLPVQSDKCGLGLNKSGITWQDPHAPIKIETFRDELEIVYAHTTNAEVYLERSGRKKSFTPGKRLRLLQGDIIAFGSQRVHVKSVYRSQNTPESWSDSLKKLGKVAMHTAAAALLLTACNAQNVMPGQTVGKYTNDPIKDCLEESTDDHKAVCCLELDDEKDKTECCKLLSEKGIPCLKDVKPETPESVAPTGHSGAIRRTPCVGKKDEDLKTCCEGLENAELREGCCRHLANHSTYKCEEPQKVEVEMEMGDVIAIPPKDQNDPILFEGKTGNDLKNHCDSLKDDGEKTRCCDLLKKDPDGLKCELSASDQLKLKSCVKNEKETPERIECCQKLEEQQAVFQCLEAETVKSATKGGPSLPLGRKPSYDIFKSYTD